MSGGSLAFGDCVWNVIVGDIHGVSSMAARVHGGKRLDDGSRQLKDVALRHKIKI